MSDPYGTPPSSDPNKSQLPKAPQQEQPAASQPSPYGEPAGGQAAPQPSYGQPAAGQGAQPPYGQPGSQPTYGQSAGQPSYGEPAAPPQYGQPGPYGGMPTAPRPVGPYGAAGRAPQLRVGDALRFAWAKFKANWGSWLLFTVLLGVVNAIFSADQIGETNRRFQNALDGDTLAQTGLTFGATSLSFLGMLVTAALVALAMHAALKEADGARPTFASFFKAPRIGRAVLTAIVVQIITVVAGVVTLGLGAIVVPIFTVFAVSFVIDRGAPVFGSIGESFRLVGRNFGAVFLLLLTLVGVNILGAIAIGLGLLITIPLSILAIAYAFRRLTGGTIV